MTASHFWKTLVPDGAVTGQRYEILQEIGAGGMATVSLGYRRGAVGFERLVAMKRALPYAENPAEAERLLAVEANLSARVHHPNVVSIIDVEVVDGSLLLVMEYIEGTSFAHLMSAGKLAPPIVARIMADVCEGLEAVHATCDDDGAPLGLVHRDISPQNILVGIDGVARLADFGIAKARTSTRTTSFDTRRGKPGYMAPEYLADGNAIAACDVFSLGVILWEALTGRRLFGAARSLEEIRRQHERPVPAPSRFLGDHDRAWDEPTLRALGRHALPRFTSAAGLAKSLERAAHGKMASRKEVARVVEEVARDTLWLRRAIVKERLRASHLDPEEVFGSSIHEARTMPEVPGVSERVTALCPVEASAVHPIAPLAPRIAARFARLGCFAAGCAVAAIVTTLALRGGDPNKSGSAVEARSAAPQLDSVSTSAP